MLPANVCLDCFWYSIIKSIEAWRALNSTVFTKSQFTSNNLQFVQATDC